MATLQLHVSERNGQQNVRVFADQPVFSFDFLYPRTLKGITTRPHKINVLWDETDSMLTVRAIVRDIHFKPWEGMEEFFRTLSGDLELFVHSYFCTEEGCLIPALALWFEMSKGRAYPSFEAIIGVDPSTFEEEGLIQFFNQLVAVVCQSLLLCRPVFYRLSVTGQEPGAEERMHLLLKTHGASEVLRAEDTHSGWPPHFNFPSGLFGGTIAKLRPQ